MNNASALQILKIFEYDLLPIRVGQLDSGVFEIDSLCIGELIREDNRALNLYKSMLPPDRCQSLFAHKQSRSENPD